MQPDLPIHDLFIRPIREIGEGNHRRLVLLADHDHLLRRFGLSEAVWLGAGGDTGLRVRAIADEVWAVVDGSVEFVWHDLRKDSPTFDRWHHLASIEPTLVLAPFGVAFGVRGLAERSLLMRFATHAEADAGDAELQWEVPA